MKLHGWCNGCRKIKRIFVTGSELGRMAAQGSSVPQGKCDDCKEKETAAR